MWSDQPERDTPPSSGWSFSTYGVIMGTRKKCSLRLFTWVALGLQELEHVAPTCPLDFDTLIRPTLII